jgi:hypothetical protein
MAEVLYLSLVTASMPFTVTETRLFLPLREWLKQKSVWAGNLSSRGYCLGHWIAFCLVAIYQPRLFQSWWLLDYFLTALAIGWLAAIHWIVIFVLMEKTGK